MTDVKWIDIKEFREAGFLQEVNRCFLHPLGLAMAVTQHDDGTETLAGIWDYRDDPEGMRFGDGVIEPEKVKAVQAHVDERRKPRLDALGYWVQEE